MNFQSVYLYVIKFHYLYEETSSNRCLSNFSCGKNIFQTKQGSDQQIITSVIQVGIYFQTWHCISVNWLLVKHFGLLLGFDMTLYNNGHVERKKSMKVIVLQNYRLVLY